MSAEEAKRRRISQALDAASIQRLVPSFQSQSEATGSSSFQQQQQAAPAAASVPSGVTEQSTLDHLKSLLTGQTGGAGTFAASGSPGPQTNLASLQNFGGSGNLGGAGYAAQDQGALAGLLPGFGGASSLNPLQNLAPTATVSPASASVAGGGAASSSPTEALMSLMQSHQQQPGATNNAPGGNSLYQSLLGGQQQQQPASMYGAGNLLQQPGAAAGGLSLETLLRLKLSGIPGTEQLLQQALMNALMTGGAGALDLVQLLHQAAPATAAPGITSSLLSSAAPLGTTTTANNNVGGGSVMTSQSLSDFAQLLRLAPAAGSLAPPPAAAAAQADSTATAQDDAKPAAASKKRKKSEQQQQPQADPPRRTGPPPGLTGHGPAPLYMSCDDERLSAYHVLARKQIEFFEANQEDTSTNARGRNRPIVLGQVGVRCRHCGHVPPRRRQRAAMYYPFKLDLLYQASQTLANVHLCEQCQHIPDDIRAELVKFRGQKTTALVGKKYWADGARARGVYESEDGLRFEPPSDDDKKKKKKKEGGEKEQKEQASSNEAATVVATTVPSVAVVASVPAPVVAAAAPKPVPSLPSPADLIRPRATTSSNAGKDPEGEARCDPY